MRYRPQELIHWQDVQDFLAPNDRVDPDAMRLYLAQYSQLNANETYPDDTDATALGVVLKHAQLSVGDAVVTAFVTYYEQFRLRQLQPYNEDENAPSDHVSFDDWLEDMAASRPDDLEVLLRQAADVLDFNHQVMVLRDAQKWLPRSELASYVSPELLNRRASVLFKEFTPAATILQDLLDVGAELMAKGPSPKHKELGDTLMRGCFFACYREPRSSSSAYRYRFDSERALELVEPYGLLNDYDRLLSQLAVRIKEPTVIWDALGYCVKTLEDPLANTEKKDRAEGIVVAVLQAEASREHHQRFNHTAATALIAVYNATRNAALQTTMVDFLDNRIHTTGPRLFADLLDTEPVFSSSLLDAVMERMQTKQSPDVWERVITVLTTSVPMNVNVPYALDPPSAQAGQYLFHQLSGPQLLRHLQQALEACGDDPARLEELLDVLSHRTWSDEQTDALRSDPWISNAVLLYLYHGACSSDNAGILSNGALPVMAWQPLPLLTKLFPEHASLWRSMQMDILRLTPQKEKAFNNQATTEFTREIMHRFFDRFAQSFSPSTPTFHSCHGLIEGLGITPKEYFRDHTHTNLVPPLALPEYVLPSAM